MSVAVNDVIPTLSDAVGSFHETDIVVWSEPKVTTILSGIPVITGGSISAPGRD